MSDKNNNDNNYYLSLGVGFGLVGGSLFATIIGFVFGLMGDSLFLILMGLGPSFGMLIGIVIGIIMDYNKNKQ